MFRSILPFLFVLFILFNPMVAWSHPTVFITLSLQEALPDDPSKPGFQVIRGVDRKQALVSFGVPLPNDTSAFETSQVLLIGAKHVQYQVIRRWDSHRIQWLLIDALVDLKANQLREDAFLTTGTSLKAKPMGNVVGKQILIDTGAAKFWINKEGFNLFDKVEVAGKEIVSSGSSPGILLTDIQGKVYEARLDKNIIVSIEHNGPVRTVIKAVGRHVSSDGKDLLDFSIRMHFVKGKTSVRTVYTLRNASKRRLENTQFRSLELVLKTKLQPSHYIFRNHAGETTGSFARSGSQLRLFQGQNAFPIVRDKGLDPKFWPTGKIGYSLSDNGKILKSGTKQQVIRLFYAQSRASNGSSVMVGTRFAAGHRPQGLGLDGDGSVRIGVFPKGNDKPYVIRFGSHLTREHVFSFHSQTTAPHDVFFRFQYPIVARPKEADWFNQNEMFFIRLVSFKEETEYYKSKKWPFDDHATATSNRRPIFAIPHFLNWATSNPLREWSFGLMTTLNFLREEKAFTGAYYLAAEQWMSYNADHSVLHSDDYNDAFVRREVPGLVGADGKIKDYRKLPGAQFVSPLSRTWSQDNHHAYSLSYWFYLTGRTRYSAALRDWGEHLLRLPIDAKHARQFGWSIFNLTRIYRFTRQIEYHQVAWDALKKYAIDQTAVYGKSAGTDRLRGVFVDQSQASSKERKISVSVQSRIVAGAYAFFLEFGTRNELQADQVRDLLEGISRFTLKELWFSQGTKPGEFGLPQSYALDRKPPKDILSTSGWNGGVQHAYLALYFGFLMTTDDTFLKRAESLLKATAFNTARTYWFQDLPGRHMSQYLLENTPLFNSWRSLPVHAIRFPDGRYQVTWKTPYGAKLYRLKYAEKKIVPSLSFDRERRSFLHDPKTHTPFFASKNILKEPKPGDPGVFQEMTIKHLDPKKRFHFAARYFSSDPRPPFSEWLPEGAGEIEPPPRDGGHFPEPRKEPSSTEPNRELIPDTISLDLQKEKEQNQEFLKEKILTRDEPLQPPTGCDCQHFQGAQFSWLNWLALCFLLLLVRR